MKNKSNAEVLLECMKILRFTLTAKQFLCFAHSFYTLETDLVKAALAFWQLAASGHEAVFFVSGSAKPTTRRAL